MFRRFLALLFALFHLPLPAGAGDTIAVTTRSSGAMTASGETARLLALPSGSFSYALSVTSALPATALDRSPDAVELDGWGPTTVTLSVDGVDSTWTTPAGLGWVLAAADLGGMDVYRHSMSWPMILGGFGLEGLMSFGMPAGTFPAAVDFEGRSFDFATPAQSLVELRVYQDGDVVGQLAGTADAFQVSVVSAVPEPAMLPALGAGLTLLYAVRWRSRLADRRTARHPHTSGISHGSDRF